MKKTDSAQRQAASRQKKAAPKKNVSSKRVSVDKSKVKADATSRERASVRRGAGATAPVVYQTLRDKVAAVEANVGQTISLSDFLKSNGWS